MKRHKNTKQKQIDCEHVYEIVVDTPSTQTLKCVKCGKIITDLINDIFKDSGWED